MEEKKIKKERGGKKLFFRIWHAFLKGNLPCLFIIYEAPIYHTGVIRCVFQVINRLKGLLYDKTQVGDVSVNDNIH